MKPLVSVILPVFNGEAFIVDSVNSILNQTLTNLELIIINDGSTDSTLDILHSINDPRIRVYTTMNRGIARALNFGIKLSNSDFIARMDADDISNPNRLQLQYDHLISNPKIDLVSCLVEYGGDRKKNLGYALYVEGINKLITHEQMYKRRFQDSPIAHPSVMFRKELIEKYGGYTEAEEPEDYELWLRWLDNGVKFNKIDHNLLIWNDLVDRISRKYRAYSKNNFNKVKSKYLAKHIKSNGKPSSIWIWGVGKKVNAIIKCLKEEELKIDKYIDVKSDNNSKNVIHYTDLPNSDDILILSLVGDRVGKREIEKYLLSKGYEEGKNFFLMS